jgi:hypothetical protein
MAHGSKSSHLEKVRSQFQKDGGLPFSQLLTAETITPLLDQLGIEFRDRIFTPIVTIWTFLSQVLSPDHSCRDAVARVVAWLVAQKRKPCSPDSASYCEARARLPWELLRNLTQLVARRVEQVVPEEWLFNGRPVKIVDGSTVDMPDTQENREKFPPATNQANGVSFPIARLVVIFSLACGTVLELALGPTRGRKTGETTLFRRLFAALNPGDILLGDRLFDSYRDIAALRQRNVDVIFRMNGSRYCDFRRGKHLGVEDHRVTWKRPNFIAKRFDRETYDALPAEMEMRELRFRVDPRGFRPRQIVLVTTLLDPEEYPAEDLAQLYRERWHCELDLRSLKTTLQMEHLRCRTPAMVEKEVWMHMLAYNLLREVMAHAAREHNKLPRRLSFKGAMQTVNAFLPYVTLVPQCHTDLHAALLEAIASHTVGDRPNRIEPRAVKRRHNKYLYLMKPRGQAASEPRT